MRSARDKLNLTENESAYVDRFIEQGEKFLEYGTEPDKEGYESKYDYGGSGDLDSSSDKRFYKQVGKKLLNLMWQEADGDWRTFVNNWRYGEGSDRNVEEEDSRYFNAFTDSFGEE